jgi:hypothetical protein
LHGSRQFFAPLDAVAIAFFGEREPLRLIDSFAFAQQPAISARAERLTALFTVRTLNGNVRGH